MLTEARAPRELKRRMSTEKRCAADGDGPAPRPSHAGDTPAAVPDGSPASSHAPTPWRRGAGPDAPAPPPRPGRRGGDEDDAGEDRRELEAREGTGAGGGDAARGVEGVNGLSR